MISLIFKILGVKAKRILQEPKGTGKNKEQKSFKERPDADLTKINHRTYQGEVTVDLIKGYFSGIIKLRLKWFEDKRDGEELDETDYREFSIKGADSSRFS